MNPLLNTPSYKNWKHYKSDYRTIPVTWTLDDLNFDWQLTYQMEQVPPGEERYKVRTDEKQQLDDLFVEWGITKEATTHLMALHPVLSEGLKKILENFSASNQRYNFLKLEPGRILQWHIDAYSTFVKYNDIEPSRWNEIKRSVILLDDWDFGQVIQIGNDVLTRWKAGDVFTWVGDTWHGAANFGVKELIVMQVTYLDE